MHNTIKNIFVLIARPYDTPVSDAPLRDKTLFVRHVQYIRISRLSIYPMHPKWYILALLKADHISDNTDGA